MNHSIDTQIDIRRQWRAGETLLAAQNSSMGAPMTRVMVIGNAGGGKSTMCRVLGALHGLPHYAIDDIQWRPGWVETPAFEYTAAHEALLAKDRWLIDGYGSWPSVERRLEVADTIILIDHPIWVHYWFATKRQIKSIFLGRPDGPEGCPMLPVTFKLYKMMWWLHRERRPALVAAIEARRGSARIIHIRSPRQLAAFVANPV